MGGHVQGTKLGLLDMGVAAPRAPVKVGKSTCLMYLQVSQKNTHWPPPPPLSAQLALISYKYQL